MTPKLQKLIDEIHKELSTVNPRERVKVLEKITFHYRYIETRITYPNREVETFEELRLDHE